MKFKEMIVDLTPLLDVILILLFMVLATQSQSTTERITALEEEVSQLEQRQMPQTQSEQTWYQTYQQSIGKVNIVFPSSLDNDPMYLVLEDGSEVQKLKPKTYTHGFQLKSRQLNKKLSSFRLLIIMRKYF